MGNFSGSDWCPHCEDLDKEVFESNTFRLWFNKRRMVPVLLDFPLYHPQDPATKAQNAQLAQQYQVNAFPSVLLISA
jgi:thioredoxin-related protein